MGRAFEVRKQSMAATAAKKAVLYNRVAREIYLAARESGADPNANLALRNAIDKAKSKQVPRDVIDRAIKKASGNDNENYQAIRYEGYGPGGSAIIIDTLTNNVNRAIAEVRNCFTKTGGKLGVNGAVTHLFDNLAVFAFEGKTVEEIFELLLLANCDVNDVVAEDGQVVVYAPATAFNSVKKTLDENGIEAFQMAEITMLPYERITLQGEDAERFEKMLNMLDEVDDVQEVYHNVVVG
ncbi:MAG: YebC/PmpR family DNA-binding transcriptional regulator [Spiroplasma poulsonii]|uniref:Probable transcriptional regulatory protein SMSRO_SF015620 n=1 Tax=Spiroplasma poulsonii TaxID=2138 RepID=A0A2P6FE27_9MOLU|nr:MULTISPECIES: YebC/PmpR family DNA-binding transcriptional regulator [Spiroplasma]KAF0850701.1 putative transcriptional regulatory protein YeeN [Spiroplasma poulsonii]MBH8623447.1 YebC/PmpR family DNA-binding transcriptional regulator [Spiroplasma sp. hyd1]MBW1241977.1 YebC/PmpR family DNA-binding transcriptional regulator [Spiroplasma poulsonii]PQM31711.1 putative transcriptional regulatory protein YeeN [Spiroplasma poulsonii]PWF96742.1 putative transcriptional regulatory protein YeeN [Spi